MAIDIVYYSPEDSDDELDAMASHAWDIAQRSEVSILSDKDLKFIAVVDGQVAGAVFDALAGDKYSFDTVVDPKYRGRGVASELLDAALEEFSSLEGEIGATLDLDVVNSQMAAALHRRGIDVTLRNPIVAKGAGSLQVQPGKISGYSLTKPNHYLYPSLVEAYSLASARGPSEPGRDCVVFAFATKDASIVLCRLWVQPCCVDKRADPNEARFVLEVFPGRHGFTSISDHKLQKWNQKQHKWIARGKSRFDDARLLCDRIAKGFKMETRGIAGGARAKKSPPFAFLPQSSDKIVTGTGGWMYPRVLDTLSVFTTGSPFNPPRNRRLFMTDTHVLRLDVQPPCLELREGTGLPRYALYRYIGEYPEHILDSLKTDLPSGADTAEEEAGNRLRSWKSNIEIYGRDTWEELITTESTQEMVDRFTELAVGGTELDWRDSQVTYPEDYYSNPVRTARKPNVPEVLRLAATNLLRWPGIDAMGGKDILAWVMKDGRYGFAIQGSALRIESRCFGDDKWPIRNHDGHADVSLQRTFGLDAHIERGRGWTGIKGGIGQTMSTGHVSLDEVVPAVEGVLNHVTGRDDCHVTLMPMRGKPWNAGSKGTPYFSAKKQKTLIGEKPDGIVRVEVEGGKLPGIDFCTVAPIMHEKEGGIVGELGLRAFLVTHSFNLDPKLNPGPVASIAKRIRECGGLLYPSLAVSEVPSTNFGTCCLVARIPVVLRALNPYKGRQRGAWPVVLYNTDAWTERTSGFIGGASAELFQQMTGTWEPRGYGHMMVLGPQAEDYSGPAEARILKSVASLRAAFKKKWRTWHREMSAEDIEEASDMSDLRYPYMEAKINGSLAVADTFPLAVCPSYLKAKTSKFLDAIGFNGVLLTVSVPADMRIVLRQEKWVDSNATAKAMWDYAWLVRDAVLAWQRQQDARSTNYKHDWSEAVQDSIYRGHGVFTSTSESDFNQPVHKE